MCYQDVSKVHYDIIIWIFKIQLKYHKNSNNYGKYSDLHTSSKFNKSISYIGRQVKLKNKAKISKMGSWMFQMYFGGWIEFTLRQNVNHARILDHSWIIISLNVKVAFIQKSVNWSEAQISWLVSIWWQLWRLMS